MCFGYFAKNFQLDASSDTLLLENDPDLKYLREINSKYGSKDFLVLTYSPKENLLSPNTIKNLTNLKNDLKNLKWVSNVITILDVPLLKNNDDPLTERIKNYKTLSSEDVDKERGFDEIINSPVYKEFVISKDGKTSGILVYIKTDEKLSKLTQKFHKDIFRTHENCVQIDQNRSESVKIVKKIENKSIAYCHRFRICGHLSMTIRYTFAPVPRGWVQIYSVLSWKSSTPTTIQCGPS